MTRPQMIALALVGVVVVVAWATTRPTAIAANSDDTLMHNTLTELVADNAPMTVQFRQATGRLGLSIDVSNQPGDTTTPQVDRVGADGVCFAFRTNANTQYDCVPFSAINAISYAR